MGIEEWAVTGLFAAAFAWCLYRQTFRKDATKMTRDQEKLWDDRRKIIDAMGEFKLVPSGSGFGWHCWKISDGFSPVHGTGASPLQAVHACLQMAEIDAFKAFDMGPCEAPKASEKDGSAWKPVTAADMDSYLSAGGPSQSNQDLA